MIVVTQIGICYHVFVRVLLGMSEKLARKCYNGKDITYILRSGESKASMGTSVRK